MSWRAAPPLLALSSSFISGSARSRYVGVHAIHSRAAAAAHASGSTISSSRSPSIAAGGKSRCY